MAGAAGVRASGAKAGAVAGMYTREQLVAQIGNKATYDGLMGTLKARGVTQNNTQLLAALLKKVPDPLELKDFLRKVDKPKEFLALLERYPLNSVRSALAEIDGQSIPPKYVGRLLKLNLESPVPTRAMTPQRRAFLQEEFPGQWSDKTFQGKSPVLNRELNPTQQAKYEAAGQQYQALLDNLLKEAPYVYRYTTRERFEKVRANGWDIREAYMTNTLVKQPNAASLGAQLKPGWYPDSEGNPDFVLRIPTQLLSAKRVPRPSGDTPQFAGWEFTTTAYPEAGKGGLLQFMGTIDNKTLEKALESGIIQIIDLKGGTQRLPTSGGTK